MSTKLSGMQTHATQHMHTLKNMRQQGFTLAEILAVVVIIGVLAAVAIPAGLAQKQRSVDAGMVSDINSIVGVLQSDLSAWRGAPPDEMTITTTDATWQMTSPPAVVGDPPVLEDSGPVTPGNNATGTVWMNGAFCVAATNPGSGNSVVYLSTEEKAVTGPAADNVCPAEAPEGAGTLPEANENDVPPVPKNLTVVAGPEANQITINSTLPPTLDPPITSYLVMIPGLEPEEVLANEIDGWSSATNIQPGSTNITIRPINANGAGPGYVGSVIVTGSILQDGTQFLGNVNSTQNLTVDGATSVNGVTNTGDYLGRNVTGWDITGSELNSEGNILALGAISSNGNIYSQSAISSEGVISSNSNITAAGNMSANGSGAFNNGLTVNNGAAINGNSNFSGNITGSGYGSFGNGLRADNGLEIYSGGATISGNSTFNNNLTAIGTGTFGGDLTTYANSVTGGNLTAYGTGNFGNTLTVTAGGVAVTGNSTFGNNLNVSGQSTVTGLLRANGGLNSTAGTFTGAVSTGALSSTTGTFTGNLTGTNASFSGTGSYSGLLTARNGVYVTNASGQRGGRFAAGTSDAENFVITPFNAAGNAVSSSEIVYNLSTSTWGIESNFATNGNAWFSQAATVNGELTANGLFFANQGVLADGNIWTTYGNVGTAYGDLATYGGNIFTTDGNIYTNDGDISTNSGTIWTGSGSIGTYGGNLFTTNGDIYTEAGDLRTANGDLSVNGNGWVAGEFTAEDDGWFNSNLTVHNDLTVDHDAEIANDVYITGDMIRFGSSSTAGGADFWASSDPYKVFTITPRNTSGSLINSGQLYYSQADTAGEPGEWVTEGNSWVNGQELYLGGGLYGSSRVKIEVSTDNDRLFSFTPYAVGGAGTAYNAINPWTGEDEHHGTAFYYSNPFKSYVFETDAFVDGELSATRLWIGQRPSTMTGGVQRRGSVEGVAFNEGDKLFTLAPAWNDDGASPGSLIEDAAFDFYQSGLPTYTYFAGEGDGTLPGYGWQSTFLSATAGLQSPNIWGQNLILGDGGGDGSIWVGPIDENSASGNYGQKIWNSNYGTSISDTRVSVSGGTFYSNGTDTTDGWSAAFMAVNNTKTIRMGADAGYTEYPGLSVGWTDDPGNGFTYDQPNLILNTDLKRWTADDPWSGDSGLNSSGFQASTYRFNYGDAVIYSSLGLQRPLILNPTGDTWGSDKNFYYDNTANQSWVSDTSMDVWGNMDINGDYGWLNTDAFIRSSATLPMRLVPTSDGTSDFQFSASLDAWQIEKSLYVGDPGDSSVIVIKDPEWTDLTLEGGWDQITFPGGPSIASYRMMPDGTVRLAGKISNDDDAGDWGPSELWHYAQIAYLPEEYAPTSDTFVTVPAHIDYGGSEGWTSAIIKISRSGTVSLQGFVNDPGGNEFFLMSLNLDVSYPLDAPRASGSG